MQLERRSLPARIITHNFLTLFTSLASSQLPVLFRCLVGCSRVSGQWPNGSSSISLAALTITANYFPCRVIFLSQAETASELKPVQGVIISTFTRLIYQYFSLSSLSPSSPPPFSIALSPKLAPTSHLIAMHKATHRSQALTSLFYLFLSGFCN